MANCVDPEQTDPSEAALSESALCAYAILSETLVYQILGHLPLSTIFLPNEFQLLLVCYKILLRTGFMGENVV